MTPETRHLLRAIVRYRGRYAAGLACVAVTAAITLTAPWVLKNAVDDLRAGVTSSKLLSYAGLMLAIAVASGVSRFLMRRIIIGVSRAVEYDLRNEFFSHLQRLPLAYFQANRTGDLMSRATNDLGAVRMMVGPAIMYTASTSLTFAIALSMMAALNPRLTLFALIPLPLVTGVARYAGRLIHERFEKIQEQLSDISAVTQESLAGVRVLRAYGQEDHEIARFRASNAEYVDRNRVLIQLQGAFYPSMGLLMGASALLVLWIGSRDVIAGRMTVGELVAFNSYLMTLSWPMIAFGWVTNLLQRGRASWGRMLAVMSTPPAITDAAVRYPHLQVADIRGAIEIRSLTYSYGERTVLRDLSIEIAAGETVAIIGGTGSGKSTLLSLIARLHDPPPATVFIDGIDVREMPLATLRGAIGVVPQEPFLFSDTLAENIEFGGRAVGGRDFSPAGSGPAGLTGGRDLNPAGSGGPAGLTGGRDFSPAGSKGQDLSPAALTAAAIARLDKDVADFPDGYQTRIGERGITLSGGQKQRTAIARALYVDPKILILDDALSAVDTDTEEQILKGLRAFMRERTSIIVSHRISTVRDADRIFVLDNGRMVEEGRHADLVAAGGPYAQLHQQQLLEEELAGS